MNSVVKLKMWVVAAVIAAASLAACSWIPSTTSGKSSSEHAAEQSEQAVAQGSRSEFTPPASREVSWIHMTGTSEGWSLIEEKLAHTDDGGRHWQFVLPAGVDLSEPYQPDWTIAPVDDQSIGFIGVGRDSSSPRLYVTRDGGRSWTVSALPKDAAKAEEHMLTFADDRHGWLVAIWGTAMGQMEVSLFSTVDAGRHWLTLWNHKWTPDIAGIRLLKSGTGFVTYAYNAMNYGGITVTFDWGKTWQTVLLPVPSEGEDNYIIAPIITVDSTHLVAVLRGGVSDVFDTSWDGGRHWAMAGQVPKPGVLDDPAQFLSPSTGWLALDGDLYRTEDGGASWQPLVKDMQSSWMFRQLDFVSENVGWAVVESEDREHSQLMRTSDGGRTWVPAQFEVEPTSESSSNARAGEASVGDSLARIGSSPRKSSSFISTSCPSFGASFW